MAAPVRPQSSNLRSGPLFEARPLSPESRNLDRPLRTSRFRGLCWPTRNACCWRPSGLDQAQLSRVLADIHAHDVDVRRSLLPAFALRKLEPGGGHRQVRHVQHRSRRRRARGERRQAGVRVFGRHLAGGARTRPTVAVRAIARQGNSAVAPLSRRGSARALYSLADPVGSLAEADKVALLERLERRARARDRACHAGDGVACRRARNHPDRAQRRARRRRRAAAGARVADRHRRGKRPARARLFRRRWPLRLRVFHRRGARSLRAGGGRPGAAQSVGARGARRQHDRRAGQRLARHPAARGDRPRPRRRFQSQGHERVLRARRQARRREGRHRRRRRHARAPARVAQHRRRRQPDAAHGADRGRHPAGLHAGPAQLGPDERRAHRQRPPRVVRAPADAADDEHDDAGRRPRSGGDHRVGQATDSTRPISAAGRSTSPAASSCSRRSRRG